MSGSSSASCISAWAPNQLAKSYLTRAIEGDDVPDEVRSRVATYLVEIDKRLSRHQLSGSLFGGARYQSNAIAGPTSSDVLVGGISSTLDDQFVTRSDGNVSAAGSFRHGYDLLTQGGAFIETNGTGYWSIQKDEKQLNLIYLSLQSGPRLRFLTDYLDNATSRPYVVASIIWLGNQPYLHEAGLGWNVTHQFSERFAGEANIERKQKYYDSSVERANAKDQEGPTSQLRLTGRYALWPNITLNGLAVANRESARQDFESNWEWGLTAGLATFYQHPVSLFGIGSGPWSTSLSTARIINEYDIPNPAVNPNARRYDKEWRLTLVQTVPVKPQWTAVGTVQRIVNDSNLPNFKYTNWLLSVGVARNF